MLDKSVPYYDILMKREKGTPLEDYVLPDGYRFALFVPGDEKEWARIEASVLEFPDELDALLYFQREFMPYAPELVRRCMFIETAAGEKVATATAWWNYSGTRRDVWLHWVAVKPGQQGRGLGRAIVARVMALMAEIEGDRDIYLHTQTWSHRAVGIYEKLGFRITDEKGLGGCANDKYADAVAVLNGIRGLK